MCVLLLETLCVTELGCVILGTGFCRPVCVCVGGYLQDWRECVCVHTTSSDYLHELGEKIWRGPSAGPLEKGPPNSGSFLCGCHLITSLSGAPAV